MKLQKTGDSIPRDNGAKQPIQPFSSYLELSKEALRLDDAQKLWKRACDFEQLPVFVSPGDSGENPFIDDYKKFVQKYLH